MASIATNDSDKSDKWKKHVNTNIISNYDILTSTLNTIAVKDAHHDKLSEKDSLQNSQVHAARSYAPEATSRALSYLRQSGLQRLRIEVFPLEKSLQFLLKV